MAKEAQESQTPLITEILNSHKGDNVLEHYSFIAGLENNQYNQLSFLLKNDVNLNNDTFITIQKKAREEWFKAFETAITQLNDKQNIEKLLQIYNSNYEDIQNNEFLEEKFYSSHLKKDDLPKLQEIIKQQLLQSLFTYLTNNPKLIPDFLKEENPEKIGDISLKEGMSDEEIKVLQSNAKEIVISNIKARISKETNLNELANLETSQIENHLTEEEKELLSKEDLDMLLEEIGKISEADTETKNILNQINNAAIADLLDQLISYDVITYFDIEPEKINEAIFKLYQSENENTKNYQSTEKIKEALAEKLNLNKNADKDKLKNLIKQNISHIKNQFKRNENIVNNLIQLRQSNKNDPVAKAFNELLLPLEKDKQSNISEYLVEAFKEGDIVNYEDLKTFFKERFNDIEVLERLEEKFTEKDFNNLKKEQFKRTDEIDSVINHDLNELVSRFKISQFLDAESRKRLLELGDKNYRHAFEPAYWVNPQKYAAEMKTDFSNLSEDLQIIIREIEQQIRELDKLKQRLPDAIALPQNKNEKETDEAFQLRKQKIVHFNDQLKIQKNKIEAQEKKYQEHIKNYENKLEYIQEKVLPEWHNAISGPMVIHGADKSQLSVQVTRKEEADSIEEINWVPLEPEEDELQKETSAELASARPEKRDETAAQRTFESKIVTADKAIVFDVKGPSGSKGRFKQEFTSHYAKVRSKDKGPKQLPVRVTVSKAPKLEKGDASNPNNLEKDKVNYYMELVLQLLVNATRTPDKNHPIFLRGSNEEELRYLWTAAKIYGQHVPGMKYGSDAIVVASTDFEPKEEKGRFFGFSSNSLYNTVFKKHKSVYKDKVNFLSQYLSKKLSSNEKKLKISKGLTQLYSERLNQFKKTENENPDAEAEINKKLKK